MNIPPVRALYRYYVLKWGGIRYYAMLDNKRSTSVKKTLKSICALRDIADKGVTSVCVHAYARTFQIWPKTRLGARGVLAWGARICVLTWGKVQVCVLTWGKVRVCVLTLVITRAWSGLHSPTEEWDASIPIDKGLFGSGLRSRLTESNCCPSEFIPNEWVSCEGLLLFVSSKAPGNY